MKDKSVEKPRFVGSSIQTKNPNRVYLSNKSDRRDGARNPSTHKLITEVDEKNVIVSYASQVLGLTTKSTRGRKRRVLEEHFDQGTGATFQDGDGDMENLEEENVTPPQGVTMTSGNSESITFPTVKKARAKLPDNYSLLYSLICYYTSYVPFTEVNIQLLKHGLKVCAHYENILARAVPGGKTVAEALAEIAEEHRQFIIHCNT
ncbi:unnamed protein product [Caenorhabditis nigoni]